MGSPFVSVVRDYCSRIVSLVLRKRGASESPAVWGWQELVCCH